MNDREVGVMVTKLDPQPNVPTKAPYVAIRKVNTQRWWALGEPWRWHLYLELPGTRSYHDSVKQGSAATRWGAILAARKALRKIEKKKKIEARAAEFISL